jgi:allophanate hydrolase
LRFFGDTEYERLFGITVRQLQALGGSVLEIDIEPFLEAARLLYEGPWIAERYAAVGSFIDAHAAAVHPITRQIIEAGKRPTAAAAFEGEYKLKTLMRLSEPAWSQVDVIVTPTAGTIYRIEEVDADPIRLNANLGFYTNFMNLFDLAGVAVPAGFRADGMPFGVTLVGPRAADRALLDVAGRLHRASVTTLGAQDLPVPRPAGPPPAAPPTVARDGYVMLAVCGAHMQGLPLNHELRDRGGYLVQVTSTAPRYRLYALPGGPPHRPGMIRVNQEGAAIELEIWALPTEHVGSFVADIPAPLAVGKIELESGAMVTGFLCEAHAAGGAADITRYGGWRTFVNRAIG